VEFRIPDALIIQFHTGHGSRVMHQTAAQLPLGRLARPDEIDRSVDFLVDPASAYITGSTLAIDGGLRLSWQAKRGLGGF
jgi:NAD(P)-dependent dehydrogenase (short-subunit alcohol dehydrogenase family)